MNDQVTVSVVETEEEYQAIVEIRKLVFVQEQNVPLTMEIDEFEDESTHFVVRKGSRAVATGRLRVKDRYVKFERIAVLKEFRGQGFGKAVTQYMTRFAAERFPELTPMMNAQRSAVEFYERLGWIAQGDAFDEAGIEHRMMIFSRLTLRP